MLGFSVYFLGVPTESGRHAEAEKRQVRLRGEAAILRQIEDFVHRDGLRRWEAEVMNSQNHHILFSSAGTSYSPQ